MDYQEPIPLLVELWTMSIAVWRLVSNLMLVAGYWLLGTEHRFVEVDADSIDSDS